ncbi:MAG: gliding motility-associated ABC transporter ATP-binding subunit GldA [Vicingaceae bacterium]|jgi:ABC-2 type transport system ATP-binding protein|tara:strand:+ start:1071 stop:1976 length:906 start_codon:yes stop_codon:yes gene_type:complete
MSIVVKNVTKLYGEQKALDSVSFSIKPGEIVGFLGPNGAGKSTMMKIITGFIPSNEGETQVCDLDVSISPLKTKSKIGYLAEQNPLYYDMYVREYLGFVAGIFKLKNSKARINELIHMVGLSAEQNKKIGQLSKGYKQRVGLAQALIHDPEVLILDEPTTGLDPNQLEEIRKLIQKIGAKKTVMLSTHIMQEVEAICDRVIIINNGKIVADDKASNLNKLFSRKNVIHIEFEKAIDENTLSKLTGVQSIERLELNNYLIHSKSEVDIRNDLFQFAIAQGTTVLTLKKEELKLEDIFKQLTT